MIRIVEENYYKLSMSSVVFRSIYFELLGVINRSPQRHHFLEPKYILALYIRIIPGYDPICLFVKTGSSVQSREVAHG